MSLIRTVFFPDSCFHQMFMYHSLLQICTDMFFPKELGTGFSQIIIDIDAAIRCQVNIFECFERVHDTFSGPICREFHEYGAGFFASVFGSNSVNGVYISDIQGRGEFHSIH